MVGVELDSADLAKAVQKAMLEQKIIINRTHETVLRFLPPFVVTKKQVEVGSENARSSSVLLRVIWRRCAGNQAQPSAEAPQGTQRAARNEVPGF